MKRKTTKIEETAAQAMARTNREIFALIEQLQENVRLNNEKFEKTGRIDWGYVGTAGAIRDDLKNAFTMTKE